MGFPRGFVVGIPLCSRVRTESCWWNVCVSAMTYLLIKPTENCVSVRKDITKIDDFFNLIFYPLFFCSVPVTMKSMSQFLYFGPKEHRLFLSLHKIQVLLPLLNNTMQYKTIQWSSFLQATSLGDAGHIWGFNKAQAQL